MCHVITNGIGSPIFFMQLCKNTRHLEVQIVGEVIADYVYRMTLNNDHSFDVQITVTESI